MSTIVTRFPPSPTGFLHIGGARTALFNWLYTRHMKGRFVLRFEDTDMERSTKASVDAILDALEWLGIDWDEGPYYQSERFEVYREYAQKLLDAGLAYYCECDKERLDAIRQQAMAEGGKPKYDGRCREADLAPGENRVIRFKAPIGGATVLRDAVKGNISFQNSELDDFIIFRSDGTPTYNFAVVVDDVTMGINTILRGDDHVNNTPKQILLYQALGAELPVFAHVPMVLGSDRSRLSKRHGAMSVTAYREMGYLPDALINYLVRLGWSFGDQEFFTRDELVEKFTMDNIGKSAGIFNPEKLLDLNAQHIKATPPADLAPRLLPFMRERGYAAAADDYLCRVIETLNTRSKTLVEMADAASFYYTDPVVLDEKAAKKFLKKEAAPALEKLVQKLSDLSEFTEQALEDAFKAVMEETGLKLGKIAQPVRVALTGATVSPGIFEVVSVLGKDRTLARLSAGAKYIEERAE